MFDLYDVPAGRRAELIELARGAKSPGWLRQYREYSHELSQGYATYISFESEAKAVHNFETLLVPGLLQTEEYARATMVDGLPIEEEAVRRRVISFEKGAHPGMNGSFARLIFGTGVPDLIYEERWGGDLFLELESEIDRYSFVFDQLRATALSPRDTSALITRLIAQ